MKISDHNAIFSGRTTYIKICKHAINAARGWPTPLSTDLHWWGDWKIMETVTSYKNWSSKPCTRGVSVADKNRVTIQIILWQEWVTDAQRCCRDRLAGGRKTLRQNDWLLLFDVSVWLTCDDWLHLQNRSALTVVMTPNISSVISEQLSDNFWWKEYTSVTKLHAIFSYLSMRRGHLCLTGSTFDVITQHNFKIQVYQTVQSWKKKKKKNSDKRCYK